MKIIVNNCTRPAGWRWKPPTPASPWGVSPRWGLDTAVACTMAWYRAQQGGADARALCLADLDAWEATQ